MQRFFGMMPINEIEKEEQYKDDGGFIVRIQAGPHGWTVIYADKSTDCQDSYATTEENFKTAYDLATNNLGTLTSVNEPVDECEGEI
jgi:negative regulator of genetic competence, sporulation and motility